MQYAQAGLILIVTLWGSSHYPHFISVSWEHEVVLRQHGFEAHRLNHHILLLLFRATFLIKQFYAVLLTRMMTQHLCAHIWIVTGLQSWPYSCWCEEGSGSQELVEIFLKAVVNNCLCCFIFNFHGIIAWKPVLLLPFFKDGKSYEVSAAPWSSRPLCDVGSLGPPAVKKVK